MARAHLKNKIEVVTLSVDDLRDLLNDTAKEAVDRALFKVSEDLTVIRRALESTKGILNKEEVAELLRVKASTVDTYVRERSLPVFRVGRSPLFLRDAVVEWVRAQPDLEAGERPPAFEDPTQPGAS